MAVDVYKPCPCGSGKKFKFCCLDVADDMEKVTRLAENNQPHVALQMLERMHKESREAPWVYTAHASILFHERQYAEARDILQKLLEKQPEHPFAIGLQGTACLAADGWPSAKPAVYRAFQKATAAHPGLVSGLALGLASLMFGQEKPLACRQYLALAMRLAPEDGKQDIFLRLLQFDGDGQIYFPLRSVHHLAEYAAPNDELQKEVRKAQRLAELGCFEPAARTYTKLAEQDAEKAELWRNVGLCRAWDGDDARAAEALHRAAHLGGDFEQAVECETLAQLLDLNHPERQAKITTERYTVKSVGRLLSLLDENNRFARVHLPPQEDEEEEEPRRAGTFEVLDRPALTEIGDRSLQPDDLPVVIAQLTVFDEVREADFAARAVLTGFEGDHLPAARELLQQVAGSELEHEPVSEPDDVIVESIPQELRALQWRWRFPEEMPVVERRRIEQEQWQRTVSDVWPSLGLSALDGKPPRDAAPDDSLRLPLRAAVHVLDAFCDRSRYQLDLSGLCRTLGVDEPQPIEVGEKLPLQTFSSMQLIRLPVAQLNDGQLMYTLNRALLIHHGRFLHGVLREGLSRPACVEKIDLDRAYMTLADLARDRFQREEALEWIAKGREHARKGEKPFEAELQWAMAELNLRLEDPTDPGLRQLLAHLVRVYGPKLPQLRNYLEELVALYRLPISIEELSGAAVGATTSGGLWTPTSSESTPDSVRKLWVPGQD